ncbi:MAG: tRNA pseudouridine(13) synthase TruD [candidate division WOR-3 bacterium]
MKIKVKPEDFVVEELIVLPTSKFGPYTLLKLNKRYWNTLDVIDFVARRLSASKERFSRAGLKDRYSLSTQYLTFHGHIKEVIEEKNFKLMPVGKVSEPISPEHLKGNKFSITVRELNEQEIQKIYKNHSEVMKSGFPNYFDEQRFGSARHRKGFFAKLLMLGHYQGAMKLLLCYPYKDDSKKVKIFKKYCAEHWGNWSDCLSLAPIEFKRILYFLKENPKDFKNAIKKIDRDLLNLYLVAYQSYLFNEILNLINKEYGIENIEITYSMGKYIFYHHLKNLDFIKNLQIPMLNEKVVLSDFWNKFINRVLVKERISLSDFKLRKMRFRGVRFKNFLRPAIIIPQEFALGEPQDDEIYRNRKKLLINFTLPPGSYATILIKRLLI